MFSTNNLILMMWQLLEIFLDHMNKEPLPLVRIEV